GFRLVVGVAEVEGDDLLARLRRLPGAEPGAGVEGAELARRVARRRRPVFRVAVAARDEDAGDARLGLLDELFHRLLQRQHVFEPGLLLRPNCERQRRQQQQGQKRAVARHEADPLEAWEESPKTLWL